MRRSSRWAKSLVVGNLLDPAVRQAAFAAHPERMPEESPWDDSRDEARREIKTSGIRVTIVLA